MFTYQESSKYILYTFRSNHSCKTQLLLTVHDIASIHDKDTQVDIGTLDFSKAFDVVPHQRLLNKLEQYGVTCNILQVERLLPQRTFAESNGRWAHVRSCYRPLWRTSRDCPRPIAFFAFYLWHTIWYILRNQTSPICGWLSYVPSHLWHEWSTYTTSDIDKLMDWADRWGMYFNASKCNVMVTLGRIHSERFYHMKGQILKEVLHAKYLGVTPSRYLAWRSHMDSVIAKANQTLGFVKRNLRGAPLRSRITAYFAIVRAGLKYAAPIWDPYLRKTLTLWKSSNARQHDEWNHNIFFLQCQRHQPPDRTEMGSTGGP